MDASQIERQKFEKFRFRAKKTVRRLTEAIKIIFRIRWSLRSIDRSFSCKQLGERARDCWPQTAAVKMRLFCKIGRSLFYALRSLLSARIASLLLSSFSFIILIDVRACARFLLLLLFASNEFRLLFYFLLAILWCVSIYWGAY